PPPAPRRSRPRRGDPSSPCTPPPAGAGRRPAGTPAMTGTYGTVYHVTDISVKYEPVQTPAELTIDELARRMGMSVRNLREWRAQGLLPPPRLRGRVGYLGQGP